MRAELFAIADRLPEPVDSQFADRVEGAKRDILEAPEAWPTVRYWQGPPTVRRRKVKPFRIDIVYYLADDVVRVVAYAHEAREPGYWRARVGAG